MTARKPALPQSGGSYIRDPKAGLKQQAVTQPAPRRGEKPAAPADKKEA